MNPRDPLNWTQFLALLEPLHERARLTARRLSGSRTDGDDLFQEAMLRAVQRLPGLRDPARFGPWFYADLLSVHRNRGRRAFWKRFVRLDPLLERGYDPPGADGNREAGEREAAARLTRASGATTSGSGERSPPGRARRGQVVRPPASGPRTRRMNKPADPIDDAIARDSEALRASTARDVPSFFHTARGLRGALLARPGRRHRFSRGAWGWIAAASAVAGVLAFVPVSYPMLAGHDVALTIHAGLPPAALDEVARGFRAGLGGEGVRVEAEGDGTTLRTRVRDRSARNVREATAVFAAVLRGHGVQAEVAILPWTTPRSGSVYAIVSDRIGRLLIEVAGHSNAEIQREITARLAAIGFGVAAVAVEHGDGRTGVAIRTTGPDGRVFETETRRELSGPAVDPEPPVAIDLAEFSDLDALPVGERREAIERRLRERGIQATVTIEDGKLRIEAVDELERE